MYFPATRFNRTHCLVVKVGKINRDRENKSKMIPKLYLAGFIMILLDFCS